MPTEWVSAQRALALAGHADGRWGRCCFRGLTREPFSFASVRTDATARKGGWLSGGQNA